MPTMQPNLREFTIDEAGDLAVRVMELEEAGYFEEAERLSHEVPLIPGMANILKNTMGIEALIASGANLSKAVKEYGHEWLQSYSY